MDASPGTESESGEGRSGPLGAVAKILGTPFSADPVRIIQTNSLIQMTGYGLYTAGSALYFVRAAGIPAERVGLGFSLAGLAGLALSVRMGRLADRLGPRDVGIAFAFARVALLITAVLIHGTAAFLIVIVCLGIAENGSRVARGALVARLVPKSGRVRTQAMTRVLTNVGFSIGVVVAGVAIAFNTRAAYASLILGMALAALLTALLSFRLPRTVADPAGKGARSGRTRYDFPYMAVSFVSSMTLIGDTVLTVGLPIWVVTHTGIPRPLAAWAILANTVLVIGLQVKFSSLGSTVASARKIQRWAFIVLAAACCAAAATDGRGGLLGSGLLLVTVALLTLGELWGERQLELSLRLRPGQGPRGVRRDVHPRRLRPDGDRSGCRHVPHLALRPGRLVRPRAALHRLHGLERSGDLVGGTHQDPRRGRGRERRRPAGSRDNRGPVHGGELR